MDASAIRKAFYRDGFVIIESFFEESCLQDVQRAVQRYIRDVVPTLPPDHVFRENGAAKAIKSMNRLDQHDAFFAEFKVHPRSIELMAQIFQVGATRSSRRASSSSGSRPTRAPSLEAEGGRAELDRLEGHGRRRGLVRGHARARGRALALHPGPSSCQRNSAGSVRLLFQCGVLASCGRAGVVRAHEAGYVQSAGHRAASVPVHHYSHLAASRAPRLLQRRR